MASFKYFQVLGLTESETSMNGLFLKSICAADFFIPKNLSSS